MQWQNREENNNAHRTITTPKYYIAIGFHTFVHSIAQLFKLCSSLNQLVCTIIKKVYYSKQNNIFSLGEYFYYYYIINAFIRALAKTTKYILHFNVTGTKN